MMRGVSIVGYVYGQQVIMFGDITELNESFNEDKGLVVLEFINQHKKYIYEGNERRGFFEKNHQAPFLSKYSIITSRRKK